jgi:uncharacterized protein YhaN
MFLVELVMQGVRGFRELARLRFQSSFNFVAAGNEAGKTTAVETMQRLLFPRSQSGTLETLISRDTPDASRGALVIFSGDGAYYRIIQDFSKRAVNLSKYDASTKDFTLIHKDWDSTVTFMAGLTTGMSEEDFTKIFVFRRDHYANRWATSAPAPMPIPRAQPARSAAPAAKKPSADQARLAELREALKKAEEAADAEYRAQSAKLALDEIRKKLTSLDEIDQKKSEIDSMLAGLKACETLPQNLSELVENQERLQGQKMAEAEELSRQLEGLKMQLAGIPATNLMSDKLFIAGACLLLLSILAPFMVPVAYASYFPIGVLASLGLMGAVWYNGSRKSAQHKAVLKDVEAMEKERAELEKRSEQETAPLKAYLKTTGATTPAELKDKADNYRYFVSMSEDIEEQRRRILSDGTPEILQKEYHKHQQEALELEKAARAVAQYNVDTYAIRQDIGRIEAESSAGASWDFGAEASELPTEFPVPAASDRLDGLHAELNIASRICGIEMETLVPAVEAAAQRNLAAISGGKYVRVEVGQNGSWPVVHARDESKARYEDQSHGTRDLVYFCLRIGLVEALAGKLRLPVLLDDPLIGFDAVRQKAACQILRALGAKTQVVLFSSNPALKAAGDAVLELK